MHATTPTITRTTTNHGDVPAPADPLVDTSGVAAAAAPVLAVGGGAVVPVDPLLTDPGAVWVGVVMTGAVPPGTTVALTGVSSGTALPPVATADAGGVGSKRCVHPMPASHTSGHACASCDVTWNTPSRSSPGVKPTATRVGMPRVR